MLLAQLLNKLFDQLSWLWHLFRSLSIPSILLHFQINRFEIFSGLKDLVSCLSVIVLSEFSDIWPRFSVAFCYFLFPNLLSKKVGIAWCKLIFLYSHLNTTCQPTRSLFPLETTLSCCFDVQIKELVLSYLLFYRIFSLMIMHYPDKFHQYQISVF